MSLYSCLNLYIKFLPGGWISLISRNCPLTVRQLAAIFDFAGQGFVVCDVTTRLVLISARAAALLAIDRPAALDRLAGEVLPELGLERAVRMHAARSQRITVAGNSLLVDVFPLWQDEVAVGAAAILSDRAEADELDAIIETSRDGIWVTDGQGKTLRINRACEQVTGLRRDQVVGRHVLDLEREGLIGESVVAKVLAEKREVTVLCDNANGRNVLKTGTPVLDAAGQISRVVVNIREITELIRLRERLREAQSRYEQELKANQRAARGAGELIGTSRAACDLVDLLEQVAGTDTAVLLLGETGVGKGLVAQVLHRLSARAGGPFVKVNCGALPEALIEAELFGYERGAFTGGRPEGKPGLFEAARGGSLFLDEVGEMPLPLQTRLLHVLEEKEIRRVGATRPVQTDVRIIAATNRDLGALVREGRFRADLYYRLHVVPIVIPPLRERIEDIPLLVNHFLTACAARHGRVRSMRPEVVDALMAYDWPGNVRELEHLVERLVVLTPGPEIRLEHLPAHLRGGPVQGGPAARGGGPAPAEKLCLRSTLAQVERELIQRAMARAGTLREAARALGIDPSTLLRKAQKLGIK